MDEAHSIGALGEHGGGVCDFYGKLLLHASIDWMSYENDRCESETR